jgi:hypothetical protein
VNPIAEATGIKGRWDQNGIYTGIVHYLAKNLGRTYKDVYAQCRRLQLQNPNDTASDRAAERSPMEKARDLPF